MAAHHGRAPCSHSRFDRQFGFAIGVPRGNSINAEFFVKLMMQVFPGKIEQALTDNGSEFCGAFDRCLQEQGIATATHTRMPEDEGIP